ncbi:MAG: NAD(P)/FAD-dependent oxidoreductase, partial [Pseudolabrys sp.]
GGAIYALSARLRDAINDKGETTIAIDLMPDTAQDAIAKKLAAPRGKQSFSNFLRKATRLAPAAVGLPREAAGPAINTMSADELASLIKAVPVTPTGVKPVATAISTAGGISFDALDDRFMLKKKPGVFAAGEMLDWEAPTGGYLLQASFATGVAAGEGALAYLAHFV